MTENQYKGYQVVQQTTIEEINSEAIVLEHKKSGAKLLLLSNDEENKVFSITFRTPPTDDTGLPHILEHSVLCGSKNFPAKDPFVELVKGSLNTFLNAMTFSDKTLYPVASCNDQDFQNLIHVYMDAVFYPNIYHEPKILQQEGWHYELESEEDDLTYKGVVYNEMKGAFSSPEQVLFRKIQSSLFPDTAYASESGGDPEHITDLTEEDFLEFHKKYYHPSNSYIFLYGNFDVEEKLKWLDETYLNDFDKIQVDSKIQLQKPFDEVKELETYYSISNSEETKDKTYLSYNYAVGEATDTEVYYGLEVLEYLLLEAPGAPLKKALIDAGIGKDVFGSFDNGILQPTLSIVAKEANEEDKETFKQVIQEALEALVEKGLDKKKIEAAINYFEFKIREADYGHYPKGVMYSILHMNSWLYDADPLMHFKYNETFLTLREGMKGRYFEDLIEKYLLHNTHATLVMVKPEKGLTTKKDKEDEEKLRQYKEGLSPEEIKELVKTTEALMKYQEEPTPPEDLEKIPLLSREDIHKQAEELPLEVVETNRIKVLLHPMFTNHIGYVKFLFDTKHIPYHLVPYIGLLTKVLGKMDTDRYTYDELASEITIQTGGIYNGMTIYGQNEMPDVYLPKFEIKAKAFYDKIPAMFDLVKEILFGTKIEDSKRLKEILLETKSRLQMQLNSSGHSGAANRAMSYFSKTAYYKESVEGITYYKFLEQMVKEFDEKQDEIKDKLRELIQHIFRIENLIMSYTAEKSAYGIFENELEGFVESLYQGPIQEEQVVLNLEKNNEGFMTSGKVQYVAKAGNYVQAGYHYSGALKVLQTIARSEYLWNNVRVKGGAYGCMCGFQRNGNAYLTSYRDPNLEETLAIYNKFYDYIRTFHVSDRDMTKFIIGTISSVDQPLTPSLKAEAAVSMYLNNVSLEDRQRERDEILSTTQEDIRKQADLIRAFVTQDNICVLGNETKLEENKDLFGELISLFE